MDRGKIANIGVTNNNDDKSNKFSIKFSSVKDYNPDIPPEEAKD